MNQNNGHNPECKSDEFCDHLCYIISQGFHVNEPKEFEAIVKNPEFKCRHCGQVAYYAKNLCEPVKL